jgi:alpha-beta hydrolase superfamily lysophospholipase
VADDAQQPKAAVLCLHELGMHSGSFESLGKQMAGKGYVTYAIDLRGFGSWKNAPRGTEKMDLDLTFKDVVGTLKAIHKAHPNLPVFVLGEAMGGAMALKIAEKYPDLVTGAISSAPGGEHFHQTALDAKVGSRLILGADKKYDFGKEFIEMGAANQAKRDAMQKDSMVRLELTPRECMQCQFFMNKSKKMAKKIAVTPVMIVQGQLDGMSRPEGAANVYKSLATRDRKMYEVKDGDHYVYEDPSVNSNVVTETVAWLESHLGFKPPAPTKAND